MTLNLRRSPHEVAPELIGAQLTVDGVGGIIVEVEAYDHEDPAGHGFRNRRTERNASMFLGGGHAYVYRSYGIHWCLNIVCEDEGVAGAVLLRALEPTLGVEEMAARRGVSELRLLCSGPGRLTQALAVTREHDGLRIDRPPFELLPRTATPEIVTGPRIGITKAVDFPWVALPQPPVQAFWRFTVSVNKIPGAAAVWAGSDCATTRPCVPPLTCTRR
jgi:DNA-3-methyladenine glycosylase